MPVFPSEFALPVWKFGPKRTKAGLDVLQKDQFVSLVKQFSERDSKGKRNGDRNRDLLSCVDFLLLDFLWLRLRIC